MEPCRDERRRAWVPTSLLAASPASSSPTAPEFRSLAAGGILAPRPIHAVSTKRPLVATPFSHAVLGLFHRTSKVKRVGWRLYTRRMEIEIEAARRYARERGVDATPYRLREFVKLRRGFIDLGMSVAEAEEAAADLVFPVVMACPWGSP